MDSHRLFIANRGEVALRIIRAARKLGMECVVPYSQADETALPVRYADAAICIGPPRPTDSYLSHAQVLSAALVTGCDLIHPGYGFLSESAEFAAACARQGLTFVGPSAEVLHMTGDKSLARETAEAAGLAVLPGTEPLTALTPDLADRIGFPMLVKAVAGGGGRGIRLVSEPRELEAAFDLSRREAEASFGDGHVYLERFVPDARHLEVQVLGDGQGNVVHLGDRECSVQRRRQKVLEEAPALVPAEVHAEIIGYALALAKSLNYVGAGTVEFVYGATSGASWFIEMNPRLQVEHAVTEMITGIDIVSEQIRVACGEALSFDQDDVRFHGHAMEWRVTAESMANGLLPQAGTVEVWEAPGGSGVRVDTHCFAGYEVPPHYDSLLAKVVAHASTRAEAIRVLAEAAREFRIEGVPSTVDLCSLVLADEEFRRGGVTTGWLDQLLQRH